MELVPFSNWELEQQYIDKLAAMGIFVPTSVQQQCWQPVTDGQDLLVQSRTGTGKTFAFALPILQRLGAAKGSVQVLIVLPTRELAAQVAKAITDLGGKTALLFGGGSYGDQFAALRSGAPIVVGTPGRLCDHIERGSLKLENCSTLILDEADEILDMGFADELDKVLAALPAERQTLLFSATMPPQTEALAAKTLHEPHRISVSSGLAVAVDIRHRAYAVAREFSQDALINVLYVEKPQLAIIFCHTRAETEEVSDRLCQEGFLAAALHGDMAQNERTRTLNSFRRKQITILVATDVAARGLDIRGISHVINLSVPRTAETYIHRVGRTGRAGDDGLAITFVAPRDALRFRKSLALAKIKIDMAVLPQAAEVKRRLRDGFHSLICGRLANGVDAQFFELAKEVLAYVDPTDALAVLLSRSADAQAIFSAGLDVPVPKTRQTKEPSGNKLLRKAEERAAEAADLGLGCIQINLGRAEELEVQGLIKLVTEVAGINRKMIGDISIRAHSTFFELPLDLTEDAATALEGYTIGKTVIKARPVKAERDDKKHHRDFSERRSSSHSLVGSRDRSKRREAKSHSAGRRGFTASANAGKFAGDRKNRPAKGAFPRGGGPGRRNPSRQPNNGKKR